MSVYSIQMLNTDSLLIQKQYNKLNPVTLCDPLYRELKPDYISDKGFYDIIDVLRVKLLKLIL